MRISTDMIGKRIYRTTKETLKYKDGSYTGKDMSIELVSIDAEFFNAITSVSKKDKTWGISRSQFDDNNWEVLPDKCICKRCPKCGGVTD